MVEEKNIHQKSHIKNLNYVNSLTCQMAINLITCTQ
jgi:hypothetical protein